MALTGNIEVFPLPEVLRLLARSGKNGCLRVDAAGVDGRIYLHEGALSLATVVSDVELSEQIASSGVVERSRIEGHSVDLPNAIAPGRSGDDLSDLIREHVVESLYRIRRPGSGSFEFLVDAESRFRTGQSFDAEQIVAEADRRATDWADIEQTIADMHLPVRMVRELAEPEVSVNAPTWRVLASLEGGSSVADIARMLGTTEFRAAREVASLIRSSLIEPVGLVAQPEPQPQPEPQTPPSAGSWFSAPVDTAEPADTVEDEPSAETEMEPPVTPSPWATAPEEGAQSSQEWTDPWSRPAPVEPETEAATEEPAAGESRGGWWAEAMSAADEVGDVDTDEFLESVFSEAEGHAAVEEESGFSMGLLRRRRMGPVARDVTESD